MYLSIMPYYICLLYMIINIKHNDNLIDLITHMDKLINRTL